MSQEMFSAISDPTFRICKAFLQFELHGVTTDNEVDKLVGAGFLSSKKHVFPPTSRTVKLYRITKSGQKQSPSSWELWLKWYAPLYALENSEIEDSYLATGADEYRWAFSKERLQKERESGRFSQAIKLSR